MKAKHGLRGLRGHIIDTTTTVEVKRSTIGEAAAKREEAERAAKLAELRRAKDEQERLDKERADQRAKEATECAAARARADGSISVDSEITRRFSAELWSDVRPSQAIPPRAASVNPNTLSSQTSNGAIDTSGISAGTVTDRMSALHSGVRTLPPPDVTPQTWNGIPVTTSVVNFLQRGTRIVAPYQSAHSGLVADARPDVIRTSVSCARLNDARDRAAAMEEVGACLRDIEEHRPATVESIEVVTGLRAIEQERDLRAMQENFFCFLPKTFVTITGYGEPVQLIAAAQQARRQALRRQAIETSRRACRDMEFATCDTIGWNGDERYVVIWREQVVTAVGRRSVAGSGRVVMLSRDCTSIAFTSPFNLQTPVEMVMARAIRTLKDQADTDTQNTAYDD